MLPVIDLNSGERLGWVKDILFDQEKDTVNGVIYEKDSFLKRQQFTIAREDIVSFGKESLNINICAAKPKQVSGTSWSQKVGSKVFNGAGDIKGTVGDIFVDNLVQKIVGYEISDGVFSDLFKGRDIILEKNILAESQDVVVVEGGSSG